MFRYAQIDESGNVVSDSFLSEEIEQNNMIPIEFEFDLKLKKYINNQWISCEESAEDKDLLYMSLEEKTIYETALSVEYLICLKELQL